MNKCKAKNKMMLMSNDDLLSMEKIVDIGKDQPLVWFSEKEVANILSPKDAIDQCIVMYNSEDMEFVIHWDSRGLLNMIFKMHSSGCIILILHVRCLPLSTQSVRTRMHLQNNRL